jgi:hypothetical protein
MALLAKTADIVSSLLKSHLFNGVVFPDPKGSDSACYSGLNLLEYDPESHTYPFDDEHQISIFNEEIKCIIALKNAIEGLTSKQMDAIDAELLKKLSKPDFRHEVKCEIRLNLKVLTYDLNTITTRKHELVALWSRLYHLNLHPEILPLLEEGLTSLQGERIRSKQILEM